MMLQDSLDVKVISITYQLKVTSDNHIKLLAQASYLQQFIYYEGK